MLTFVVFKGALVRRAGCGSFLNSIFLKKNDCHSDYADCHWEVTVESGGNFEDYTKLDFYPVNCLVQ